MAYRVDVFQDEALLMSARVERNDNPVLVLTVDEHGNYQMGRPGMMPMTPLAQLVGKVAAASSLAASRAVVREVFPDVDDDIVDLVCGLVAAKMARGAA